MSTNDASIYRVILRNGTERRVVVTKIDGEDGEHTDLYSAKAAENWPGEGVLAGDPLAAVARVVATSIYRDPEYRYGWPVREIVEPGKLSREEALAEAAENVASLGRWLSRTITAEDALAHAIQRILLDASSAPNCSSIEGSVKIDGVERVARVSVQWADGKNPQELLREAVASHDALVDRLEQLTKRHRDNVQAAHLKGGEEVRAMWLEDLEDIALAAEGTQSPMMHAFAGVMRERAVKIKAAKFDIVDDVRPKKTDEGGHDT